MVELTQRELQNIQRAGGIALECTTQDELRDELLSHIQATLGAPSGVFTQFHPHDGEGRFTAGFSRGVPDGALEIWCREYQKVDPFVCHFLQHIQSGGERVVISSNVVRNRDYVRSAFYCDFLKPQSVHHVLVAGLVRSSETMGILGLHRPARAEPFNAGDVLKMNLILPHLSAAIEKVSLVEKLAARQSIIDTLAHDLARSAVLMLDDELRVLVANETAVSLLHLPADGNASATILPHEIRDACKTLCATITTCALPSHEHTLSFSTRVDGRTMEGIVRANDNSARGLRYIVYFGPECRRLVRPDRVHGFGLSGRESEIVHLVSLGLTNIQIADKLGISVRTVENHLRSIFSKVKVHNRTSLLAHLALD